MTEGFYMTIENKLVKERRDINVYHHATRSAHIISFNSTIILPLRAIPQEDYLHVSVLSGPGYLNGDCLINLPSWVDFDFTSGRNVTLSHLGARTILKIPRGLPTWELKMIRPTGLSFTGPLGEDKVTIGEG
jgi:hypothetical protein